MSFFVYYITILFFKDIVGHAVTFVPFEEIAGHVTLKSSNIYQVELKPDEG